MPFRLEGEAGAGCRRRRSPRPGGRPHRLRRGPLPGILQPARPEAGSGEWQLHNPDSVSVNRKSEAPRARLRAPGPWGGPWLERLWLPGGGPLAGGSTLYPVCTPAATEEERGASLMPAPGGPSGTSDEAWVPHRCRGWGGQRQLARAGPANWDAQVWDVAPGAVPGSGVSLWKGPWGRREARNPPLKTSTVSHMSPEWRARVLEEDGVLPPDHRGPRGRLGLVFAFPMRAPCKRVSLYFSVPSHPEKGWRQPCRVHLCCDLPSPPSTVPALSTPWDLCQLSHSPSVAGQGGLAGQCCRLPALPPFPTHVGSRLGGVRVLLGCV